MRWDKQWKQRQCSPTIFEWILLYHQISFRFPKNKVKMRASEISSNLGFEFWCRSKISSLDYPRLANLKFGLLDLSLHAYTGLASSFSLVMWEGGCDSLVVYNLTWALYALASGEIRVTVTVWRRLVRWCSAQSVTVTHTSSGRGGTLQTRSTCKPIGARCEHTTSIPFIFEYGNNFSNLIK